MEFVIYIAAKLSCHPFLPTINATKYISNAKAQRAPSTYKLCKIKSEEVPLLWAPSQRTVKRLSLTQRLAANSTNVLNALTGKSASVGSSVLLSEWNAANLLVVSMKRRQSAWKRPVWLEGKSWANPQIKYAQVEPKSGLWESQLGKQVSGTGLNRTPRNQLRLRLLFSASCFSAWFNWTQHFRACWAAGQLYQTSGLGTAGKEWRVCQHTNCGTPRLCMTSTYKVSQTCESTGRRCDNEWPTALSMRTKELCLCSFTVTTGIIAKAWLKEPACVSGYAKH